MAQSELILILSRILCFTPMHPLATPATSNPRVPAAAPATVAPASNAPSNPFDQTELLFPIAKCYIGIGEAIT
jgi:hypothetical protein